MTNYKNKFGTQCHVGGASVVRSVKWPGFGLDNWYLIHNRHFIFHHNVETNRRTHPASSNPLGSSGFMAQGSSISIMSDSGLDEQALIPGRGIGFLFWPLIHAAFSGHPTSYIQWIGGGPFSGDEVRWGCRHSCPSSAGVKNMWSKTSSVSCHHDMMLK